MNWNRLAACVLLAAITSVSAFAQALDAAQFEARRRELREKYAAAKSTEDKKAIFEEFKKLALAQAPEGGVIPDQEVLDGLIGGGEAVVGSTTPANGGTGLGVNGGNSAPPAKPGQPDPFEPIAKVLRQFQIGRESLAAKDGRKIPVRFAKGGKPAEARVDFAKGTVEIVMNQDLDPVTAALYFVHEIHHATEALDGHTAQPDKMGMDEYVQHMVREESDGTARSIRGRMELEAATGKKADVPAFPGEGEYRWAYKVTIEDPLAKKTSAEAHADAAEHLFFHFYWLDSFGPSPLMGYKEYYERDWKKANAKKP